MKNNFWFELKKPILALAPMAGITDSAFRTMCKNYGADVLYSEMASASALFFNPEKTLKLLSFTSKERPYIVQLFGNNPKHFAKAAEIVSKKIRPNGIDINFGCPARKVFSIGSGCSLMENKKIARKILEEVLKNTLLPVSIKIRTGIKKKNALKFVQYFSDLPFQAIMVHGRTYEERFTGSVDFQIAEELKKIFPDKIVLANGGIFTPEDAQEILEKYSTLDGLGIARGAWGKPFIFKQIKLLLEKRKYPTFDFEKIKKNILQHVRLIQKNKGNQGLLEMRKHFTWYIKGFPGASNLRKKLIQAKNLEEIKNNLDSYVG